MYHKGNPMVAVNFRLMAADRERALELAARSGSTLSDWLRCVVQEALRLEGKIDRRSHYWLGETSVGTFPPFDDAEGEAK